MDLGSYSLEALTRRRPLTPRQSFVSSDEQEQTANTKNDEAKLKRSLKLLDIIFYGVGCSVGAGIYSLVGIGAMLAGPAITISFAICGVACCFTSLAYAEFAARVPLAGSAYTFTYVTFGELCGWLVGWNLTLGYGVSASVVARSWAEYLMGSIQALPFAKHLDLSWLTKFPVSLGASGIIIQCCPLAMLIVLICTLVLIAGVKESTRFNTVMTILNLTVLAFVLLAGVGSGSMNIGNLLPIFPHGIEGMARGAGLVFFSYLGFDMTACLSEEVENPQRNMPRGIVGSLLVSMSIYIAVSLVIVGIAPVNLLGADVPIVNALLANGCCTHDEQLGELAQNECLSYACSPVLHPILYHGSLIISVGAIFGLTTATFACLLGQPRIFYSMAQDGLLFKIYAKVNRDTGVPTVGTILTGVFTAIIACVFDLESLANVISLGTLQVFTFVNAGVILLRTRPEPTEEDQRQQQEFSPYIQPPEASPLVSKPDTAAIARSLGLIKTTSREIQKSLRETEPRLVVSGNGAKPMWYAAIFTVSATLASIAFSSKWSTWSLSLLLLCMLVAGALLFTLPQSPPPDTFSCPFVPAVPLLGILSNSYMMGSMPVETWGLISIWLLIGLLFYFGYGIHFSELRVKANTKPHAKKKGEADDNDDSFWGDDVEESSLLLPPTSKLHSKVNNDYQSLQRATSLH